MGSLSPKQETLKVSMFEEGTVLVATDAIAK